MVAQVTSALPPSVAAWLCARRDELTEQLVSLDDEVFDAGVDLFRDRDESIDRLRATVAHELDCIDAALIRISADDYSCCERCDGEIDAARLAAFPHTTRCASCARA